MMRDAEILSFIREKGHSSRYITSVCTGSLILAAAGLLTGVKATTHWSARNELGRLGAIVVKERIVFDGNRITGGGITSGIDFGLKVVATLIGEDVAKAMTLFLEYDPAPPLQRVHRSRLATKYSPYCCPISRQSRMGLLARRMKYAVETSDCSTPSEYECEQASSALFGSDPLLSSTE